LLTVRILPVLLTLLIVPLARAQIAPQAPRDGVISGRVVDAVTGRPVSTVVVSLGGSMPGPNGPRVLGDTNRILTGADGRFLFTALGPGSFTITATKNGYAEGASGRRRPGGASQPVVITAAERTRSVDVRLWKNGSIGGTVTDEAGEPVVGVRVTALMRTSTYGRPQFIPTQANGFTDDRGAYRFSNLLAGEYLVVVVPPNLSFKTSVFEDVARTGRVTGDLSAGMFGANLNGMVTIGDAVMPFGRGSALPPTSRGRLMVYPPTMHPSATSAAQASVIALAGGEERSGIDVQLMPSPTAHVGGTLIGPGGAANQTRVQLIPAGSDELPAEMLGMTSITDSTGGFVLAAVPAGQYTLRALSGGDSRTGGMHWVEIPMSVAGSDIDGIAAVLAPPLKVSARTQFDGTAARPPEPSGRFTNLFSLEAVDRPTGPISIGGSIANGVVTISGYMPGRYRVRVQNSPTGWMFRSAMLNGVDVSETPFDLTRDVTDLVLTFTDRWSGMSGTVQGTGADEATVLVFTTDSQAWRGAGNNARRVKSARASATGAFGFGSLPPGDYYVTAIREADADDWREPATLEILAREALQVSILEGEHKTIAVPIRQVRR
jgi:hypothetical protein